MKLKKEYRMMFYGVFCFINALSSIIWVCLNSKQFLAISNLFWFVLSAVGMTLFFIEAAIDENKQNKEKQKKFEKFKEDISWLSDKDLIEDYFRTPLERDYREAVIKETCERFEKLMLIRNAGLNGDN